MIQEFVNRLIANKQTVLNTLATDEPSSYIDIVRLAVEHIRNDDGYGEPDPKRIHTIDDGDYQGTLLFVIAAEGYQPSTYWCVKVFYGSCGGCDTLQAIHDSGSWNNDFPTESQVQDYWTLILHVVQNLKEV